MLELRRAVKGPFLNTSKEVVVKKLTRRCSSANYWKDEYKKIPEFSNKTG